MFKKQFQVYGVVQGVGFRYFTWKEAVKIGVVGYVKNLSDGSVSVVAQGSASQLDALRQWLQKGPKTAIVERVIELDYLGTQTFDEFSVQR
ncbi:acylphosphatase [Caviibacterium pharyngocola]|uniref:Acylphosphatase n=1 Tax=Caviibacterium pharyngocola TaxID=28159 RepID=A0A2M8RV40_9PAST|nr:acylphosphatase [Caviibacterium pharyngocola]PJG82747.1 acylphosphatase [Caviibacterium pharyngocola]